MSESTQQPSAQTQAFMRWFRALIVIGAVAWFAVVVYQNATQPEASNPFKLGLDLAGGSHLIYEADVSGIDPIEVPQLMNVLRDVIERRINVFGVSEPIVQVEKSSFVTDEPIERLVVELPGVTDVSAAVAEIGRTPLLEFKLYSAELDQQQQAVENLNSLTLASSSGATIGEVKVNGEVADKTGTVSPFLDTGLTGRYLETASLEFAGSQTGQLANEPMVAVRFTDEGAKLFAEITAAHVGEQLGIFLDGELLSAPVINEAITGGTATISGSFTPDEARALAQNLSFGALPVPITLQSTQTVGASLGVNVLEHGVKAGVFGFSIIVLFMMLWYRLPGLVSSTALLSYIVIMLGLFQLVPVTLTAAGLAGFVLSLGMAVDANVLVFERMKEEFRSGSSSRKAAEVGFIRAWSAIRDGNITSLLSAIILFWFGTSVVKGFALVFGMGVVVSMFSALTITRTLLMVLPEVSYTEKSFWSKLLGCGLSK
ncbi:protein translocase subunit SecD [Candidatus Parcubacteria bacterium]|nr:protein translocase subunit SecD [Candidatus Parcubacteria bacterium]